MSSSRTQNLIKSRKFNINNCNSLKCLTAIAYTLCQAQFIMEELLRKYIVKIFHNQVDGELMERWNYAIADVMRKKK